MAIFQYIEVASHSARKTHLSGEAIIGAFKGTKMNGGLLVNRVVALLAHCVQLLEFYRFERGTTGRFSQLLNAVKGWKCIPYPFKNRNSLSFYGTSVSRFLDLPLFCDILRDSLMGCFKKALLMCHPTPLLNSITPHTISSKRTENSSNSAFKLSRGARLIPNVKVFCGLQTKLNFSLVAW